MRKCFLVLALLGTSTFVAATAIQAQTSDPKVEDDVRRLEIENKPWTGDLDGMIQRRVIRVLIPYSRTLFFLDRGRERGITAELARDFEAYVNRTRRKQLGRRPVTVVIVPTTRDQLLGHLAAGLGDIAAGNLTVTPGRTKLADFVVASDEAPVREVLITGPGTPAIGTLNDLSGRTVHVRPSSSYHESLVALNAKLAGAGKPPVVIAPLPDALEDEDVLELMNAGVLTYTVVDEWVAKIWAPVLPKIRIRGDVVLSEGRTGWAIRPDSPQLKANLTSFYQSVLKKQGVLAYRLANYHKRVRQIANNTQGAQWKRFESVVALFRKYGDKYSFDPLMLTAQGFQESRLDQSARSHAGAIGVMQLMPATGRELRVGDIHQLEPNIHAGAKYMDQLMTRFFPYAKFSDEDRPLFAFASYNAGPGRIADMRDEAGRRGLDPNKWFNNVELVVADKVGFETTTYVRNIFKYYAAYTLTLKAQELQREAREDVKGAKP